MANPTVDGDKWPEDDGNLSFEIISDAITLWLDCYDVSPDDVQSLVDKLLAHLDTCIHVGATPREALAISLRSAAKSFERTRSPKAASTALYYALRRHTGKTE